LSAIYSIGDQIFYNECRAYGRLIESKVNGTVAAGKLQNGMMRARLSTYLVAVALKVQFSTRFFISTLTRLVR